jgi:hypothetical protein
MKRPIEDGLSLLAGAGLGVAMMYLLDPESGADRRRRLREGARQGLASAGDSAGNALGMLSAQAADLAENLRSGGTEWSSRAADAARGLADSARDIAESSGATGWFGAARDKLSSWRDSFTGSAGDAYESARDTKRRWVRSAADTLGAEREHHYVGQTACALGSLALGAGLLWAFDPRLGRSRRAWLADKTGRFTRDTGDFFRRTGKYMSGQVKGTVAGTRGYLRDRTQPISDRTLCARVRSELGRIVQRMGDIDVQSNDGYVILIGEVDGPEIDTVANFVLGMRGVRGLDNRLRPRGSGGATGGKRSATGIGWAQGGASAAGTGGGQRSQPMPSQPAL